MFLKALYAHIAAPNPVSIRLGLWDFDGSGLLRPCVFTIDPAPPAAPNPVIVIQQDGGPSEGPTGSRSHLGIAVSLNVRIWFDKDTSERLANETAQALWMILTRWCPAPGEVDGWEMRPCTATVPQAVSDDEGFPGYNIQVIMLGTKTAPIGD